MVAPWATFFRPYGAGATRHSPRLPPIMGDAPTRVSFRRPMTPLVVENVTKNLPPGRPRRDGAGGDQPGGRPGRVPGGHGGQRVGQKHAASPDGRPHPSPTAAESWSTGKTSAGCATGTDALPPALHRAGLPVVQPDPHADGRGEHRPAAAAGRQDGRAGQAEGGRIAGEPRPFLAAARTAPTP